MKNLYYLLCLLGMFSCSQETKPPLNVIYISVEDMPPYLGCYGHPVVQSPNMDAFAQEALLFEDVHCQVPLCTPSRTSILTGIRPSTSGIVKIDDDWRQILPDAVSLPRHFRNNGYYTHAVGKISDPRNGGMDDAWDISKEEWGISDNTLPLKAIQEVANQNQPFFLAIGYKQAHDPWEPAQQHLAKYDSVNIDISERGRIYKNTTYTEAEIKTFIKKFYASVTEVDSLIGEVINSVKKNGLFKNSLIILGALDHGYSLGYHNKWGKGNNYDPETMVPLLIRLPGNPNNGRRSAELVELVDLYPTLVDYCQLPLPPQRLEGTSLRSLLENPDRPLKKAAFTHRAYHAQELGVKTKDYCLITRTQAPPLLFDRQKDPNNLYNIAEEKPEILADLLEILKGGWENAVHSY